MDDRSREAGGPKGREEMNVLLLYGHDDHAEPLLRASRHFEDFGVSFSAFKSPVPRKAMAWADVILQQEPPIDLDLFNHRGKTPMILLERIDGAQLRGCREHLHQVAGVIKGYLFRDRGDNNRIFDRSHVEILHKAGVTGSKPRHRDGLPSPIIAEEDAQKVFAGYGFGSRAAMGDLVNSVVDLDASREIDVSFHGHVEYEDSEIETHRLAAVQVVEEWAKNHPLGTAACGAGRTLSEGNYRLSLLRSKCVLSPFGWGEACCRDYQAMALGAVVIKPNMDHVECWPDIFKAGETYLPCKPDWSDAHQIIQEVVDNWADYRRLRETARHMAVQAFRPELVAKQMAWAITTIMDHHNAN